MSIGKRFFMFLLIEIILVVAIAAFIVTGIIRQSPSIIQSTDAVRAEIAAHFTTLGYEESRQSEWIRLDPLDNLDSRMTISFYDHGDLESIVCETGYINTLSADTIYSDMEATVQAMGDSLEQQKDEIMSIIDEIKNDRFATTNGKLEHIRWKIESNTYSDIQGGKVRYVCFTAYARFEDRLKN